MNLVSPFKMTILLSRLPCHRMLCGIVSIAMLVCHGPLTPVHAQPSLQAVPTSRVKHKHTGRRSDSATSGQSIRLYGRWVIDVRNPDGSVAQHRAFENTISNVGNNLLIALLAGQVVGGPPSILATAAQAQPPCSGGCSISPSLAVTSSNNYNTLVISGQITATQNGTVDTVQSSFVGCNTGSFVTPTSPITQVNPYTCNGLAPEGSLSYDFEQFLFTSAQVSSVSVNAGQTIQISVAFSFTSL